MSTQHKIFHDRPALAELRGRWRAEGKRVVFTNGVFDLFHPGHLDSLRQARALGQALVVATNTDESVRRLKGPERPILPLDQRLRILASFDCVDAATPFDEDTPEALLELLRPDVLVKGGHYRIDQIVGHEKVFGWGGKVVAVPLLPGFSTTSLIDAMRRGGKPAAAR
ncbi:MAG: adenylyltransferase/cytidyltransferase family protein [Candidatus Sumerlaeia bacterium]|nr:adenylyltransferase/cytidyltransferase family protein [Candidatus Sumerlaeia bacterium]